VRLDVREEGAGDAPTAGCLANVHRFDLAVLVVQLCQRAAPHDVVAIAGDEE
jgi:hypothetical protein